MLGLFVTAAILVSWTSGRTDYLQVSLIYRTVGLSNASRTQHRGIADDGGSRVHAFAAEVFLRSFPRTLWLELARLAAVLLV